MEYIKKLETSVKTTKKLLPVIRYDTARTLKIKYEAAKRNPVVIIIILIILSLLLIIILQEVPKWQVSEFEINDSITVAQVENSYRATLAQIIGGFALLLGLYFTWKSVVTAKESQITELFTQAIDQLGAIDQFGNPAIEIRLGGIYALEKISIQSKKDHWPIMNILTAYIRKNSPIDESEEFDYLSKYSKVFNFETPETGSIDKDTGLKNKYKYSDIFSFLSLGNGSKDNLDVDNMKWGSLNSLNKKPKKISVDNLDIQAILTVIGRRKYSSVNGEPDLLDIRDVDLPGADFPGANLDFTLFIGTNLKNSNLIMASLKGAFLQFTNLEKAFLQFANLKGANLEDAYLKDANLEDANLKDANLEGAVLDGTNLRGVRNLSFDQLSKVNTLYNAKLDEKLLTLIKEKRPSLLLNPHPLDVTYDDTRWSKIYEI